MLWLAQYKSCNSVSAKRIQVQIRNEEREDGQRSLLESEFQLGYRAGFCEAIMGDIPGLGEACAKAQVYRNYKEGS